MEKIDAAYVAQRVAGVNNAESFARGIAELVLQDAEQRLEKSGPAEVVNVDGITASVSQHVTPKGIICAEVCINTPFGKKCWHVGA